MTKQALLRQEAFSQFSVCHCKAFVSQRVTRGKNNELNRRLPPRTYMLIYAMLIHHFLQQ